MRAYSMDLRVRVLADYDGGMGTQAVAEKYRVSTEWVRSLRRLREQTGQIAPRRGKPGPKPRLAEHADQVARLVEEQPDATLGELQQQLGVTASITTIWRALKALGLTLKKSSACGGTGSSGCSRPARRMAVLESPPGTATTCLSR